MKGFFFFLVVFMLIHLLLAGNMEKIAFFSLGMIIWGVMATVHAIWKRKKRQGKS